MTDGAVDGVRGSVLEPSDVPRSAPSSREVVGDFELHAPAVIVTSGGIGGNFDLVRQNWPPRMGTPPKHMIAGVPDFVDGRMIAITEAAGGRVVNRDRMWHYVEGIHNYDPVWTNHGIRILPGPSSVWLDATGKRLPVPLFPGFDTLGTLEHIMTHRPRPHLVRADEEDHRQGVRPVRPGAEPGPHRQVGAPGARPRPRRHAAAGARVPRPRRRLRPGRHARRADRADEQGDRRRRCSTRTPCAARSSPATARWTTSTPRTCRSPRCGRRAATCRTRSPASPRRTS